MSQGVQKVHAVIKVKAPGQTRIVVLDTQDLSVGRSPENDLALEEPEMSRRHMVFRRTPEGFRVEDMGTSNGTLVNGESVEQAVLAHGDKVCVGEVEIVFAQTSKNPASIGSSVEFASQLKSFGSPMEGHGDDGEATILGLMEVAGEPDDDGFAVQSAGDFALDLDAEHPPGSPARNLDDEVADLGPELDDDEVAELAAALDDDFDFASQPSTPSVADDPDPVWELDDDPAAAAPAAAKPEAPAAPAKPEAPASPAMSEAATAPTQPSPRAVPAPAPSKHAETLTLTLEIEGAEGELRTLLEGLAGKVLEVPSLRVRVKADDLG